MSEAQNEYHPLLRSAEDIDSTPVYPIIHMIRQDMMHFIDTPLPYDALTAPDLTYTLIRPLEEKYMNIQRKGNLAVVFCLLLNRVYFLRDEHLATAPLSGTRAALCEILAIRTLREFGDNTLDMAIVTTTSWRVYSGADEELLKQTMDELDIDEVEERVGNAIEMAIIGKAKRFIKSSACQRVIDSIWSGRCVYQAQSNHSILSDTYKRTPIHFYDPHKAPLLDHYRLKVPAVRSVLEYMNFIILFVLFVLTLEFGELNRVNWAEGAFMFYALGFSLEKMAAMQEHGVRVFFTGTWNGFDIALITIFTTYASLRIYGIRYDNLWARSSGIDCLALAACLIFPRLAFVTLKNNLMVLSLRAMILQFVFLMLIAVFCFAGFLYALWTLAKNEAGYSAGEIFWWMADLWFGLDATGFALASTFHEYFGPMLMVAYTCLSNTLLLTILVSILSNTFATINEDAAAEAMFRRAVLTIEGVKADYLFSYQPPINVIALIIMLPSSYIMSPRWFHKFNVFMIRLTSFPILLVIAYYERQSKQIQASTFTETVTATAERVIDTLPKAVKRLTFLEGLFAGSGADIDAIFELEQEIVNNHSSALDMDDLENTSVKHSQRRVSDRSRRFSEHSTRGIALTPSVSMQSGTSSKDVSNGAPTRPPAQPLVRPRMNSIMQREAPSTSYTSPLAQIYTPLVVDDDIIEEEPTESAPAPPAIGPSLPRRRLSSMHHFPPMAPVHMQRKPNSSRSQGIPELPVQQSPASIELAVPEEPEREVTPQPEEASHVVEEEGEADSLPQISTRLNKIEERQRRIEELLLQLSKNLQGGRD